MKEGENLVCRILRTEHSNGESSKENFLKNSAGKPSGPGHMPDCIAEMASAISAWDMDSSNFFLMSDERLGILRSFRKSKISSQSV